MANLNKLIESFNRYIDRLYACTERIEKQFTNRRLTITDVELFYTSAFLSAHSRWEAFLEECLIEVSCGKPSSIKKNFRLAEFKSRPVLRRLLLYPDKNYISLPTLKQAIKLAELLLDEGRPFSQISDRNQTFLRQAGWIRNAIAHHGEYAINEFREKVPGVTSLPGNRRMPGPFLRNIFRISPTQRRYEIYFTAFKSAASEIKNAWT